MAMLFPLLFPFGIAAIFLAISYFILITNRNIEPKALKIFGKTVAVLLWLISGLIIIFSVLVALSGNARPPYYSRDNILRNSKNNRMTMPEPFRQRNIPGASAQPRIPFTPKDQVKPGTPENKTVVEKAVTEQPKTAEAGK